MARIVVVAYGNPLRRDDGVGWRVAERIAQRWLGKVAVQVGQQLVPEWAADLAAAEVVFFVDASDVERSRCQPVAPAPEASLFDGHTLGPAQMLRLVETAYGRPPRGYVLQVPAVDFAFGEALSSSAAAGVEDAIRLLDQRIGRELTRVDRP